MKKFSLGLCFLSTLFLAAQAQQQPRDIQLPLEKGKMIYRYSGFRIGTVILRNGIMADLPLNYNITLDEMHFINDRGDTLSLADPRSVSFISLNNTRFYFDNGYLEMLDTTGGIVLAFRQSFNYQYHQPGAYGGSIAHEGVRNYSFYNGNGQVFTLGNDPVILTTRDSYFFGDVYGHFSKTGKAFLYEHLHRYEPDLASFIKKEKINFNRLPDLMRLMTYCRHLDGQ